LLPIPDDVDSGLFLITDRYTNGVLLGFDEFLAVQAPGCPELLRVGEPGGFGKTSCDGRCEHGDIVRGRGSKLMGRPIGTLPSTYQFIGIP